MSNRIELTPAQLAKIPLYVEKHLKLGLSTERANYALADEAARKIYKSVFNNDVAVSYYARSPNEAAKATSFITFVIFNGGVEKTINNPANKALVKKIKKWVTKPIYDKALISIGNTCVEDNQDFIETSWNSIKSEAHKHVWNLYLGQFYQDWQAFIEYFINECNVKIDHKDYYELSKVVNDNCGFVLWANRIIAIIDRPEIISRDESKQLHSENSPAIKYGEYELYFWHGVNVDRGIIMEPEKITTKEILAEKNQEIKRIKIERYGYMRYVQDMGGVKIAEDETGKLWHLKSENISVVEVVNGSPEPNGEYRKYFLSVPPEMKTAIEAVAWTYGMSPEKYKNLTVRT